ncbi:hypothetical protein AGABI1DRAFT_62230 [Agaricus bisporus var. burnettii JB137-S8]|uniref:Uncharacterized protein n=1 Tax=Agaricus bisporus var. burnettii (strain JB137-S8 / ATCC MYA-4627 / FGSC 10392) TaxID=597362 RepID=K5X243_AGABU|nr:uncharacterized protein AGABI1DRAFT_62230 [Agaricus bisporus var. burnettii JB137-S8]EKM77208.1 hypothetical protein AGABI1DRAFT_62230 [Agaricus bisporus var. burnettii JB137-S8]
MSTPALQSFRVSRPEPTSRLYRLLIILFTLTALLGAYFAYRPMNKTRSNKWWTFDTRKSTAPHSLPSEHASSCDNSVEDKINDLAKTFGIPPRELASAIAVAVKSHHTPTGSDSSVASKDTLSTWSSY